MVNLLMIKHTVMQQARTGLFPNILLAKLTFYNWNKLLLYEHPSESFLHNFAKLEMFSFDSLITFLFISF